MLSIFEVVVLSEFYDDMIDIQVYFFRNLRFMI